MKKLKKLSLNNYGKPEIKHIDFINNILFTEKLVEANQDRNDYELNKLKQFYQYNDLFSFTVKSQDNQIFYLGVLLIDYSIDELWKNRKKKISANTIKTVKGYYKTELEFINEQNFVIISTNCLQFNKYENKLNKLCTNLIKEVIFFSDNLLELKKKTIYKGLIVNI